MNRTTAATIRFLYVWLRSRGMSKEKATTYLKEAEQEGEEAFVVFLNELTTLLAKEVADIYTPTKKPEPPENLN